jgi:hypothetical protein
LDEADSDNISAMIEVAVRKLNFLTRPIAHKWLKSVVRL